MRSSPLSALLLSAAFAAGILLVAPAHGQRNANAARDWRTASAATVGIFPTDIAYVGSGSPASRYDYNGLAFGAFLTQPGLLAGVVYGPEQSGIGDTVRTGYLGVLLRTQRSFRLGPDDGPARTRFFVPVAINGGFRRITREGAGQIGFTDDLGVTTVALASGIGVETTLGGGSVLHLQATPGLGVASRDIGNALGLARQLDAEIQATFGPVAGRFGVSAGYSFGYLRWGLGSNLRLPGLPRNAFNYRTLQHGLRMGVAF